MEKRLNAGDRVAWDTPQGETTGVVKKKLTKTTTVKGHRAKATADEPQYLVESEKSGKQAAHRPDELKKRPAKKKS